MPSILSVGNDAVLTKSRAAVLATALQASVIVADPPAALLLLRDQRFDLVVLCHTVSSDQAGILLQAARNQSPPAKTLLVDPLFSGALVTSKTGERTGPSADPAVLVAQAKHLLDGAPERTARPLLSVEKTGPHLRSAELPETPAI
jgi:hypothetical protein